MSITGNRDEQVPGTMRTISRGAVAAATGALVALWVGGVPPARAAAPENTTAVRPARSPGLAVIGGHGGQPCDETFDGVTPPALPTLWTVAFSGSLGAWTTSATNPSSAPNDAFGPQAGTVGNTELISPPLAVISPAAQLTFRNLFNTEASGITPTTGFDGMVLEISNPAVSGGAFQDIITAGGSFVVGGYTRTISSGFMSPLAGRQAWSGLSGGTTAAPTYITTTVTLPATANGQNITLKWRMAADNSAIAAGQAGVRIDDISGVCTTPVELMDWSVE